MLQSLALQQKFLLGRRLPSLYGHPLRSASGTAVLRKDVKAAADAQRPPFQKLLAANRGEIAIRILRAATELDIPTISVFSDADRYAPHRYKADESYLLNPAKAPVAAYLDVDYIVGLAKQHKAAAVHPGYGFLSENASFAEAVAAAGITFIGPPPDVLRVFGDKTAARALASSVGVPIIPGTGSVSSVEAAKAFAAEVGYPIIIKAAHGGGGRGMRVVRDAEGMAEGFTRASSEATASFGNGEVFLEKYIEEPRHIEVQILADRYGNVVHLYERDCSVQRRHQKVLEMAPSRDLSPTVRQAMLDAAVKLCKTAQYVNAGTVEFLLDTATNKWYFIEVNPRVQVEHTVTEEVTGIDIVASQIQIAAGRSLPELGLTQEAIKTQGWALQCRITTEDPSHNFQPDTGVLTAYRSGAGSGIRLDDGPGYPGAQISPHYDSLLVKVTAHAPTFDATVHKLIRAVREHRIRGVSTNIGFLLNVLKHPAFLAGAVTTRFIERYPEVLRAGQDVQNRGERLLRYLSHVAVNGPDPALGATGPQATVTYATVRELPLPSARAETDPAARAFLRGILTTEGPAAFAAAVRQHPATLVMDTTWRDAHQSLLATRVRTKDILAVAGPTRQAYASAYSLENWGGATFDVAMRFLRECPWDRLAAMREAVPDIPFQMLLRGANAVGYTSYPDNAVYKFCDVAHRNGMDIFRVFDSLNYLDNLKLGCDAAGAAGGVVEAALCYTGDVTRGATEKGYKYNLDYYLNLARALVAAGTHVLAVKDMAGLLTPQAATLLIGALRQEFPHVPIHVHTHDTAGTGVASMVAAVQAGADVVDTATDSLSGTTSQPSVGALVASLKGTRFATDLDQQELQAINDYWEEARGLYAPFESGQLTGSASVYESEIPGGQWTNMYFQSKQLGLAGQWPAIQHAYAEANRLLGDIPKVTPSSKVVGDLAQFMVTNKLDEAAVRDKADTLSFPSSVVEYFQGYLGVPMGGFPEPLRSKVVKGRRLPNGQEGFTGRPGAQLPPLDFTEIHTALRHRFGDTVGETDLMSYVMYPKVFEEWQAFKHTFGDPSVLPTHAFLAPLKPGAEISFDIEPGKTLYCRLRSIGPVDDTGHREVLWDMNGELRPVRVRDAASGGSVSARAKAAPGDAKQIGAPMPGVVVDIRVKAGEAVKQGTPLLVLSAMKMETVVAAAADGTIAALPVAVNDQVQPGDLLVQLQ